ncbi:MAG TPA: ABC transporter permease [Acidobacteriaceae bacterium]|jgi:ABC-2 type transport system permease protein|nr:ABC transporter permease [Acidobacteriaceae bacterium]
MPSSLHNVWLVARREYLERVHAKSFVVMTILIPVLMGGILFGAALANRHLGSASHIAVITSDPQFAADLRTELTGSGGAAPTVDVYAPQDPGVRANLDAQLKSKQSTLDGYLVVTPAAAPRQRPSFEWVAKSKADIVTRGRIADAIRGALTRERLTASGMASTEVDALLQPVDLAAANGKSDSSGAAFGSAYGMFFLMYFVILFYGMNVARSIIEEKTSRVFEVLLATIKPTEMLAGKVIGVGAVGLSQVGIWIVVALAALKFQLLGADVHILPTLSQTIFFIVFFLLGYLLYSSIAAALGAMTNSEQELQQMNIFLMLPLIACSVVVFAIVTNPDGALAQAFSFFPFCTPLIMYMRVVVGKPGAFAIGISIAELIVTIALVLWIASRIYRVGILMYGKKPNLPEILRWLKYS